MRAHVLAIDGTIENTILVESLDALDGVTLVDAAIGGQIGDKIIAGNVVPAPLQAAAVPQEVDMYQAHLALIDRGHMARVREVLDAMPGVAGEKARAYFDQSPTMKRKHPLVLQLMPIIPLTDTQVDELFIHAHTNF